MPHLFQNWTNEDLQCFILNAIVWSVKLDIPAEGVRTTLPDLASFKPASVAPQPASKRTSPAAGKAEPPVAKP